MLSRGVYWRYRTFPSGKRVRLAISPGGRILGVSSIASKVKRTRTGRRLTARQRRIRG